MQVVHSIYREPPMVIKAKPVSPDKIRRDRGLVIMKQRDLAKVMKEYRSEIAEIQSIIPGWMPGQEI